MLYNFTLGKRLNQTKFPATFYLPGMELLVLQKCSLVLVCEALELRKYMTSIIMKFNNAWNVKNGAEPE